MGILEKKEEAIAILRAAGIISESLSTRRTERVALALLAVANIRPDSEWSEAETLTEDNPRTTTTREIIRFWNEHYEENVSSGSYDDVRRKDLLPLVESELVLKSANNPNANTNNPTRGYATNPEAIDILRLFNTPRWEKAVAEFISRYGSLRERLERPRAFNRIPVVLPGGDSIELSPGPHNELQKQIVEEFLPRFAPGAEVLYIGDTEKKALVLDKAKLDQLGFFELAHDTLPDVVAYDPKRNWIFLIEAVHSSNPITGLRHLNLERMTKDCTAPRVYVSVFANRRSFREWVADISWETEVWLADSPDHLVHFDGVKFLGPYEGEGTS